MKSVFEFRLIGVLLLVALLLAAVHLLLERRSEIHLQVSPASAFPAVR